MLANQKVWLVESNGFSTIMPSFTPVSSEASTWQKADSGLASTLLQLSKGSFNVYVDKIRWVGGPKCTHFCLHLCLFWSGPIRFGGVQIIFGEVQMRFFWTNFCNLDPSKTNWTWPKRLVPVQNHFGYLEGQGIRVNIVYVEVGRWSKKANIFVYVDIEWHLNTLPNQILILLKLTHLQYLHNLMFPCWQLMKSTQGALKG